jgi:hypothetical protein
MSNPNEKIRLHVHWRIKVAAILILLLGTWVMYKSLQFGSVGMSIINLLIIIYSIYLFFVADTKIDVDQNEIRIIAPHGEYVLNWNEVIAVENNKFMMILFAKDKALAYNLRQAGKERFKFEQYVNRIVSERQVERSRPSGISNSEVQKLMRKTKVRGWKLF